MKGIFITGTDTGVGKTYFTALLTRSLREQGLPAIALKPVASGDRSDATTLSEAMGGGLSIPKINPVHFAAPLAPYAAATLENRPFPWDLLRSHWQEMSAGHPGPILVEGVEQLCQDLEVDPSDILILALAWKLKAEVMCHFTRNPRTAARGSGVEGKGVVSLGSGFIIIQSTYEVYCFVFSLIEATAADQRCHQCQYGIAHTRGFSFRSGEGQAHGGGYRPGNRHENSS